MALDDDENSERVISIISLKYGMVPSEIERLKYSDVMRMYSYILYEQKMSEQNRGQEEMV